MWLKPLAGIAFLLGGVLLGIKYDIRTIGVPILTFFFIGMLLFFESKWVKKNGTRTV